MVPTYFNFIYTTFIMGKFTVISRMPYLYADWLRIPTVDNCYEATGTNLPRRAMTSSWFVIG